MIVEPDFLTHWKTQMLIGELSDNAAPLYVIALWAHCQQRKTDDFPDLNPSALRAICRYSGDGSALFAAMTASGFIKPSGTGFLVHGWADVNAKLFSNWQNGKKGGRPAENPQETQPKPKSDLGSRSVNPPETDKSRGEGNRDEQTDSTDEKKGASGKPKAQRPKKLSDEDFLAELRADALYHGLDIDFEYGKMVRWCATRNKQPTQLRFIRWLNNADRPMTAAVRQPNLEDGF